MRRRDLLISLTLVLFIGSVVAMSFANHSPAKQYHPRSITPGNEIEGAIAWLAAIRSNKATGDVNMLDIINARNEIAAMMHTKALGIHWNELGPNNVGGRTRAILIDKDNHNLLYAGGVSGGLWKSTTGGTSWLHVSSFPEMNISCIAQSPVNGYLYVGTGEIYSQYDGEGSSGFVGSGLYESTDGGATWHIFNNATPSIVNSTSTAWAFVNRIAFNSSGRLYAATNKGLLYCDHGATTWVNPIFLSGTNPNTNSARSLSVAADGTVAVNIGNGVKVSPDGSSGSFVDKNPTTGMSRVELAFAPSNSNYLYACAENNGSLKGVFRSTNKGDNWTLIGPAGAPAFNLFGDNNQGWYDNVIAVAPNNPDRLLAGGIDLWEWNYGGNFTQISVSFELHVDLHSIVFDRSNPNICYIGCDGGIAKTSNGGLTFTHINKNYSVTQMYGLAVAHRGAVMGGTQDNSCPYISRKNVDPKTAEVLYSGDGGWAAFSYLDTAVFFGTSQYAGAWRSPDKAQTYQQAGLKEFFSAEMLTTNPAPGDAGYAPFVTPLMLWESVTDTYNPDSVWFKATDSSFNAGETVLAKSSTAKFPFPYTLTANLNLGDSIRVQDPVVSKYFICTTTGIWMTRQPLNFAITPKWYKISNIGDAQTMHISKDGNFLFVGMNDGRLFRISNLLVATDSIKASYGSPYCVLEQKLIRSFGQAVTCVGIDPNNANRIVVALGNYGSSDYIYYSSDALAATPVFTSKQGTGTGKLAKMPVYSCMIEMNHPNRVLIGTEYGIFATDDITEAASQITWTEENAGMDRVPVFQIKQQVYNIPGVNNWGNIYIGTHGRGFFECTDYHVAGIAPNNNEAQNVSAPLSIFPNPASTQTTLSYTLNDDNSAVINVYDITGKLVQSVNLNRSGKGQHTTTLDVTSLSRGTYIVQLISGITRKTAKMIVTK